jgi:hypothetical protein
MKKSVLWCVAICAGAVSFTAGTALAVMYGKDIYSCARDKASKLRAMKDKALIQFLSKSDHANDAQ